MQFDFKLDPQKSEDKGNTVSVVIVSVGAYHTSVVYHVRGDYLTHELEAHTGPTWNEEVVEAYVRADIKKKQFKNKKSMWRIG